MKRDAKGRFLSAVIERGMRQDAFAAEFDGEFCNDPCEACMNCLRCCHQVSCPGEALACTCTEKPEPVERPPSHIPDAELAQAFEERGT